MDIIYPTNLFNFPCVRLFFLYFYLRRRDNIKRVGCDRIEYYAWIAWTRSPPDHRSHTCLNWELSEIIATVHQGVITVEIKRDQNASKASDEDPMDAFSRRFIT